jgi:hypothetical protein
VRRRTSMAADSGGGSADGVRRAGRGSGSVSSGVCDSPADQVANPHETARDDVQEKPSEEFIDLERQDLGAVVVGIVLPTNRTCPSWKSTSRSFDRATRWVYRPR